MDKRHRTQVQARLRLRLPDGTIVRISELACEPTEFEGRLSVADVDRLWEETSSQYGRHRAVPRTWRDATRWRRVLEECGAAWLSPAECLRALEWDADELEARGLKWLVELVAAGLEADEGEEIWERPCIALAGKGGLVSPAQINASGTLLVHTLPQEGLAATLDLAQQIARPFRARNHAASSVRKWLGERGVLRERTNDAEALRALAGAARTEPLDLSRRDKVVVRLRNSFEQLPEEERKAIGGGVGRNIQLHAIGGRPTKRSSTAARPSEAYLPSSIDKSGGWPTAAGKCSGLKWLDTRYSKLLAGARGQGALAFLRSLGAATAPRLVPGRILRERQMRADCIGRNSARSTATSFATYGWRRDSRTTGFRRTSNSWSLTSSARSRRKYGESALAPYS